MGEHSVIKDSIRKQTCMHVQKPHLLPVQTTVDPGSFKTKTALAAFPEVSVLGALKNWSSVDAKHSKTHEF